MTELLTHFLGALYGAIALILGAFGAHALKKKATAEQLAALKLGCVTNFITLYCWWFWATDWVFNTP